MPTDLPERSEQQDHPAEQPPAREPLRDRVGDAVAVAGHIGGVVGDIGRAAWQRFAAGPRGTPGLLRWVMSYAAYLWLALVIALAWVMWGPPREAALWWLLVMGVEIAGIDHAEVQHHAARHWAVLVVICLLGGAWIGQTAPAQAGWVLVGFYLVIAGAVSRRPIVHAQFIVRKWAGWIAAAVGLVIAYALLVDIGTALLHPAVAWVDPPARPLLDAAIADVARVIAALLALALLWVVIRHYRRRGAAS